MLFRSEYREDRPEWWNNLLQKKKTAHPQTREGRNENQAPSPSRSTSPSERRSEARANALLAPRSNVLRVESLPLLSAIESMEPRLGSREARASPAPTLESFIHDTLTQTNHATGCWIFAAILEAFILLLAIYNRG